MPTEQRRLSEDMVFQKLGRLGQKPVKPHFILRMLLAVFTLASILISGIYLSRPAVYGVIVDPWLDSPPTQRRVFTEYERTTSVADEAVFGMICTPFGVAVLAFLAVRIGDYLIDAKYICAAIVFPSLGAATVSAVLLVGGYGSAMIAVASPADWLAVYGVPIALGIAVGALLGWRIAELT